jgi:hypothetical protein
MGVFTVLMTNGAHFAPILGGLLGQFLGWRCEYPLNFPSRIDLTVRRDLQVCCNTRRSDAADYILLFSGNSLCS